MSSSMQYRISVVPVTPRGPPVEVSFRFAGHSLVSPLISEAQKNPGRIHMTSSREKNSSISQIRSSVELSVASQFQLVARAEEVAVKSKNYHFFFSCIVYRTASDSSVNDEPIEQQKAACASNKPLVLGGHMRLPSCPRPSSGSDQWSSAWICFTSRQLS